MLNSTIKKKKKKKKKKKNSKDFNQKPLNHKS